MFSEAGEGKLCTGDVKLLMLLNKKLHTKQKDLLAAMREGEDLTQWQHVVLIFQLSIPAILAQLSSIILEYADASMVGRLGAGESASIGLVTSTTWLFGGLCSAVAQGYTIQVAHSVGGRDHRKARILVRHGLLAALLFSLLLMAAGLLISSDLPRWLGGDPAICKDASVYFRILMLHVPLMQLNYMAGGMLQCSGEMRVPGFLNALMCFLNIILNALLIFPSGTIRIPGLPVSLPGVGLRVAGAAWGTVLAELICVSIMLYYLLYRSPLLKLQNGDHEPYSRQELKKALRISVPAGFESVVTGSAYVAFTAIVAPLGMYALAANSFSITAESLCYMPGYGIAIAATTLIGQCFGAGRTALARRLSWLLTVLSMFVMSCSGLLMYMFAPQMIGLLSPVPEVRALGTMVLRIEAFAEPLYAASIVISGIFRGYGNTLVSSILNLISMWAVRIPLAAFLAGRSGLRGVWTAMCIELCVRGILFIVRLSTRDGSRPLKK